MTDETVTPDPRTARDATPPGRAALLLRPVGYLAVGLVGTAVGLALLGLMIPLVGIDDHLRALLSSAVSICGVSAAIAAAGAVKAKKEHLA
ncbi:MAG: putative sulfate exporter family transporter, partial [Cellulosimicrobium funkei]